MQKLKNADRELVLTKVLTEAFVARFNALRDELHANVTANIAAAYPRFVELYNDPTSKPWIACRYLDSVFLPDGRKAFRPHFGKRVEEPRCASQYSRVDNATGINVSQKQYLPAPQSYTAKITDEALQAKYDKAWADYIAAYDKISAVLSSYTTREKLAEDFPDFAKHVPLAQRMNLPAVVVSDVMAELAAVGVPAQ